ncbi:MAG: aminotransferase class III-fold pyridoxal phosphate-dependent enzyme, partial [Planctomycetota bacterium]|nr:aminotransferase class III-fold pyridoxal phosphate-dependent enzyme [Planctomycetota bacterium]
MTSDKSAAAFQAAQNYIPGGVNSPVRAFSAVGASPRFIQSGSGSRLIDIDGNEYVDYVCSWGPLILGHAHAAVVGAVQEALQTGSSFGAPTERETELARKIVDAVPSIEKVRLVNSGTEAAMSAIRLARGFTGRDKIIKFEGCYHGVYDYAQASDSSRPHNWGDRRNPRTTLEPSMARSLFDEVVTLPWNDIEACRTLIGNQASNLAAVVFDPLPAALGLIAPDQGFVEFL